MSVILDALKKLDREKSRRSGSAVIAAEILKPDPLSSGRRMRPYLVAFSLTALLAAGVTYGILSRSGWGSKPVAPAAPVRQTALIPPSVPEERKTTPQETATQIETPKPIQGRKPSERAKTDRMKEPVLKGPAESPKLAEAREPAESKGPADGKGQVGISVPEQVKPAVQSETSGGRQRAEIPPGEKKTSQETIPEPTSAAPEKAMPLPVTAPVGAAKTPPELKLTAIGWYEEPSNRFAVVNGMMANVGTVIDGAKVIEVTPSSVRFLYQDRAFEVFIK